MNGELVKRQDRWDLYAEDGSKIGSSAPNPMNKLSIKNCQAIEDGYDLDELLDGLLINRGEHPSRVRNPLYGEERQLAKDLVQKALEILGDKKFSEEDIIIAMTCMQGQEIFYEKTYEETQKSRESYIKNYIQSLQQTEWNVEIVTEKFFEVKGNDGIVIRAEAMEELDERNDYKLDKDGCLILKRK